MSEDKDGDAFTVGQVEWQVFFDDLGRKYYFQGETKTTTWYDPRLEESDSASETELEPVSKLVLMTLDCRSCQVHSLRGKRRRSRQLPSNPRLPPQPAQQLHLLQGKCRRSQQLPSSPRWLLQPARQRAKSGSLHPRRSPHHPPILLRLLSPLFMSNMKRRSISGQFALGATP
jgi:hypothetical protein